MSNKELTTKQQCFLDNLVETGGDPKIAAKVAGYSGHSQVVKSLKREILDLAEGILAQSAPQAAFKLIQVMNSDTPIPQANMRLQAAQTILDRVGLAKTDRVDVTHKTENGIFILPAKKDTVIDGEYKEA
jgi:phage terminase small subunit|tara:strand:- start:170 stop:559 length:390 start_codon:yes stop_codon:yes gene_type:complete